MTRTKTPSAKPAAPAAAPVGQPGQVDPPARTRLQIDVTPDVLELLEVVSGVTGQPKTGLILEALMLALPGFVQRAESLVLAGGKIQTLKTRKPRA